MAWREDLLKAGGAVVSTIGLIGTIVTGLVTYTNNERAADNRRFEIERQYQLESKKAEIAARQTACTETFRYLGDEQIKPLDKQERLVVDTAIERNLESCPVSGDKR